MDVQFGTVADILSVSSEVQVTQVVDEFDKSEPIHRKNNEIEVI